MQQINAINHNSRQF